MPAIFDGLLLENDDVLSSFIVPHPRDHLRSLPLRIRWEVTRRHPYYFLMWQRVRDVCAGKPVDSELERLLGELAIIHLRALGVSDCPPDPANDFEELGASELNSAWLSGAVHPVTFGGMANWLIAALPKETLTRLGILFVEAGEPDNEDAKPRKVAASDKLFTLNLPGLDLIAQEPLISIDLTASEQKLVEAFRVQVRQWKEQRNLPELRDRSDKYPEYLEVWDLREGWAAGQYRRDREQTLREVAEQTKRTIPTLGNQYERAFQLITGHSYSRPLWAKLFGGIKLSELMGEVVGRVSRRRPLISPTRRPVAESMLRSSQLADSDFGMLTGMPSNDASLGITELLMDIESLIRRKIPDQQIIAELELEPNLLEMIAFVRRRIEDGI